MKFQIDVTKSITKSFEMDFVDEDALDDYINKIDNGDIDFDDIDGSIIDNSIDGIDYYELEEN